MYIDFCISLANLYDLLVIGAESLTGPSYQAKDREVKACVYLLQCLSGGCPKRDHNYCPWVSGGHFLLLYY